MVIVGIELVIEGDIGRRVRGDATHARRDAESRLGTVPTQEVAAHHAAR